MSSVFVGDVSLYERLIGKEVKIVFMDGDRVSVFSGEVISYDSTITTIEILDNYKHISIFINAKTIQKLEVLE